MVRKLKDDDAQIRSNNGTARATIKQDWADWANLEPGTDCTAALVETKYGLAVMFWAHDQPTLEDIGEEL